MDWEECTNLTVASTSDILITVGLKEKEFSSLTTDLTMKETLIEMLLKLRKVSLNLIISPTLEGSEITASMEKQPKKAGITNLTVGTATGHDKEELSLGTSKERSTNTMETSILSISSMAMVTFIL